MKAIAFIATGAAALASAPAVQGHGYIVNPAAQWTQGYASNGYGSTIDTSIWGEIDGSKYGYGASGTTSFFKAMFPKKGGGSLSALIAKNQKLYSNEINPECGLTTYKDSARSKLPASQLTFTGFTHSGPCEVWCDDTKVLFDYDCQTKYSAIPAEMSYDESKCANANRLTIYWIAMHGEPWQVYTDCVWLKGGSGRGAAPVGGAVSTVAANSESSNTTTTTNTSPSTSTTTTAPTIASTPSPQSEASIAGEASTSVNETPSMSTTEESPSTPTTEAPSTSTSTQKCARRQ